MKRVVVIGSGMGGLTAARLLQLRGMDVTVLEQHYRPGGMLHRFYRPGAAFDTGFHYCGGIDAGQPLGQALRHLGVFDRLRFHALDPDGFDVLRFGADEVRIPTGWDRYTERLIGLFPAEEASIHAVIGEMRRAVDAYGAYRMRAESDLAAVLDVEGRSLASLLDHHVRDPHLRMVLIGQAVLYGVPPEDAPVGLHSLILDHFLAGAYTIEGGGDALALVRTIRAAGGRVLLRSAATSIEVRDGSATAVLVGEQRYEADLVVSNLHPRLTLGLLPEDATRKAYRTRVADTVVGHAHLGVYLTIRGRAESLGNANFYGHPSWDPADAALDIAPGRTGVYFASAPSEHTSAPDAERGVVLMLFPMQWSQVARWAGETPRSPEYVAYKDALLATALDRLERDHPSLRGRVISAEVSTPLTTEHFTHSPEGATYGHYHSVAQMGRYRPSQTLRVKNVRLVGQGVSNPGILGTTLSAYHAVGHELGDPAGLLAELRAS